MTQAPLFMQVRRMIQVITDVIATAYRGNPWLTAVAALSALCLIPTYTAYFLDDRRINDISVWIKPMKFQASLAIHLITVAFLLEFLQREKRFSRLVFWLSIILITTSLFEMIYITYQAAQGQTSHYNLSTPFLAAMYSVMGVSAIALVGGTAWIGFLIISNPTGPRVLAIGAGLGLILGGILGGITGIWMGGQPGHWVGGAASDAGGLPIVGWARDGGDLRVAHFFGLHLMQALPLLALLLWGLQTRPWRLALYGGAAFGTLLTVATFVQAIAGRPFL